MFLCKKQQHEKQASREKQACAYNMQCLYKITFLHHGKNECNIGLEQKTKI